MTESEGHFMHPDPRLRTVLLASGGLAVAVVLTACSGSSAAGSSGTTPAASPTGSSAGTANRARGPAASGTIAAITGTTMQVQNQQTGQVAVSWSTATRFTHPVTVKLSSIKPGDCVTAAAPSATSGSTSPFTATTVTVTPAPNGSCTGGFGGQQRAGNGSRPSGFPSGFPSGARPSGSAARPSGFPSGGVRRGTFASGPVTAVSGSTITIAARDFRSSTTTPRKVTLGPSTKMTTQASTTAKSLAVGKCVTAEGTADTSGAVKATRVQITDPTNGQCSAGFGRQFGGGAGG
jgi:hypothetical protein